MVKVKCGAITKEIPKGALKWYEAAGWKVLTDSKKKEEKNDKTNSKETATT